MKHDYSLQFKGYKLQGNEDSLEHDSGIYCVYACTYDAESNTVNLKELLYIGQAQDFHDRHIHHEGMEEWKTHLQTGDILCYSRAHLDKSDLTICESALVFKYDPPCNHTADKAFHHEETHIVTSGANMFLDADITVIPAG